MKIALWTWHTPYARLLSTALPEHTFYALATPYNRSGWNETQRPRPENVTTASHLIAVDPDVVLLQTPHDIVAMQDAHWPGPTAYLSHNRVDQGEQEVVEWLNGTGVPLICISPMKAASWEACGYEPFKGGIPVVLPYVDAADYTPTWTGEGGYVLTVANNLRRPLFSAAKWIEATADLPTRLVGSGNEGLPGAVGPASSWEALKDEYRRCAVYLNPTVPPWEDPHNLSLLEARATGAPWTSLWDMPADEARTYLMRQIRVGTIPAWSDAVRSGVASQFPKDRFVASWRKVLEDVTRG
jgi:hypothetical protein